MLSKQMIKPHVTDDQKLKNISAYINDVLKISYNEGTKLLCDCPSLFQLLNHENWDLTLANIVAHSFPKEFLHVPKELVTQELYRSYLMHGAKLLKGNFNPIVYEDKLDLSMAIFLLRTCNLVTEKFSDNKKYKNHLVKSMTKNSNNLIYLHIQPLKHKIKNNPEKFLGKSEDIDLAILKLFFFTSGEYDYDFYEKLVGLVKNHTACIKYGYYKYDHFMLEKYKRLDSQKDKNELILSYLKELELVDSNSYVSCSWRFKHTTFYRLLLDEFLKIKIEFKDGSTVTIKDDSWFMKSIIRKFRKEKK